MRESPDGHFPVLDEAGGSLTVAAPGLARRWWTQKRWWVAILLCVVTLIGYVDRLALSVAAPVIRREFGLTNEQYGFITFAFLATYAAGQLLLGPVIDRLGSKRSLSLAVFSLLPTTAR